MDMNISDKAFDPQTLADDLCEVHRIYARFFATLDEVGWDELVHQGVSKARDRV